MNQQFYFWVLRSSEQVSLKLPLWNCDYFELKAIKTQQMQRKCFPLNYLKEFVEEIYIHKGHFH